MSITKSLLNTQQGDCVTDRVKEHGSSSRDHGNWLVAVYMKIITFLLVHEFVESLLTIIVVVVYFCCHHP